MSHLANLSILAGGVLNGYKEMTLGEKWTLMSVGTGLNMIKVLGSQKLPLTSNIVPALFLGVPFIAGSAFCIGTVLGKAGRRAVEN
jgi:hypothetical protein